MDARLFDTFTRAMTETGSRRGLLAVLTALLGVAGLREALNPVDTEAYRRGKRRKKRHQHQRGDGKQNRKGKRKGKQKDKAEACSEHSDCGTGAICADGACQLCTVSCAGTPAACGSALQTALDAGGTVYVCLGTYQGGFTIETAVSVIGAGEGDAAANNTILDGTDAAEVVVIAAGTGTVEFEQVRITGGTSDSSDGGGIHHLGTTLRMTDYTVSGNEGSGIFSDTDTTLELTRCTISDNRSGGGGGAINAAATLTLTDCLIEGNNAPFGAGIASGGPTTLVGSTEVRSNTAKSSAAGSSSSAAR